MSIAVTVWCIEGCQLQSIQRCLCQALAFLELVLKLTYLSLQVFVVSLTAPFSYILLPTSHSFLWLKGPKLSNHLKRSLVWTLKHRFDTFLQHFQHTETFSERVVDSLTASLHLNLSVFCLTESIFGLKQILPAKLIQVLQALILRFSLSTGIHQTLSTSLESSLFL